MRKTTLKIAAIVPAAGQGRRFGGALPKTFVLLQGKPLLVHTLERLSGSFPFQEILVLVHRNHLKKTERMLQDYNLNHIHVLVGGATRAESVKRGVERVSEECRWVLVHDGARPFVDRKLVLRTISAAKTTGVVLCAIPVIHTVKKVDRAHCVISTEDRNALYLAQTPQIFRKDLLLDRYRVLQKKALQATDEAALFDGSGVRVKMVEGDAKNIKITTADDLGLFNSFVKTSEKSSKQLFMTNRAMRIGIGYDIHRLKSGRKLVLGGVSIPHSKGLWGHSDGDVLIHSVVDALLGAAGLGDIGEHFSDKNEKYKNADSRFFLRAVRKMLRIEKWTIVHIDTVLISEKPKLSAYKAKMSANVAHELGISSSQVNVKAKTNEGLGKVGRNEAMACQAMVLLKGN